MFTYILAPPSPPRRAKYMLASVMLPLMKFFRGKEILPVD